jgi:hypothetical protein
MDTLITVETDMFEHREAKPHFLNPCCLGEDFALWLRALVEGTGFAVVVVGVRPS